MNLLSLLSELTRAAPEAPVAIDADPENPIRVSRAELRSRALWLRAELGRAGVDRGDCVAVWLPNWSDTLCWQFATASLGAHVIGVNTRYNTDEVAHVLDRARPKVLAIAHDFHGLDLAGRLHEAVRQAGAPPPTVAVVPGPHGPAPDDVSGFDVGAGAWLPAEGEDEPPEAEQGDDELAVAFTTSGSTGKPKLAAHRESAVTAHALADAERIGITDHDVVLCALPLSGVFGFNTAMAALAGGATCLLEPVFAEEQILGDMARFGVTHVVAADDMLVRITEAWRRDRVNLPRWRWLGVANFLGKVPDIAEWAQTEFRTSTAGVYGSSEVFALTAIWPRDEPAPRRWTGGGQLVSTSIQARVVDPATELVLDPGTEGELQFRGPNVVNAYLGDPDAARRSFTPDGWFRSGDLGILAEDGAIEYHCRMGDVLRLRGFLVNPAEIEERLTAHVAVRTAKVVGVQDADGATQAIGFVVLDDGGSSDPEALRAWCAETLAHFKVPKVVRILDEMPTTSGTNGTKIQTGLLREWARESFRRYNP
ncbi:MAG: AMP-binding protein [Pseudonocardiaceae bacterium]|nr:AMP-binding protein [Pseudonocardiaceae bacterium]